MKAIAKYVYAFCAVATMAACSTEMPTEETKTTENVKQEVATQFSATNNVDETEAVSQSKGTPFIVDNYTVTRTGAEYKPATSASEKGKNVFYWTSTDGIWIEKTSGNFVKTTKTVLGNPANNADFYINGAFNQSQYNIRYTGNSSSANQVTFANKQIQDSPNNANRLGEYGDCGVATATKHNGRFEFKLEHKAAYLVLNPYSELNLDINVGIRAVYVSADQALSGTFDFDNDGVKQTSRPAATANNKTVAWFYKTEMSDRSKLKNEAIMSQNTVSVPKQENVTKNGIIIVLPPGDYTNFTIEYALMDPTTQGCGYYKQSFKGTVSLKPGKNRKIAKNIVLDEYDINNFYMWDAPNNKYYWYGNESYQPTTLINNSATNGFATSDADPRWYNKLDGKAVAAAAGGAANVGTNSCSGALNVNQAVWFMLRGEPRWDDNMMYVMKNHLYNGGIWIKTFKTIVEETNKSEEYLKGGFSSMSYTYEDFRKVEANLPGKLNRITDMGRPAQNEKSKYTFLPALGGYGKPKDQPNQRIWILQGTVGQYWTSTACDEHSAYMLWFQKDNGSNSFSISVEKYDKEVGLPPLDLTKLRKN